MKTKIITPDGEQSLDDLVKRARSDSVLKELIKGEKEPEQNHELYLHMEQEFAHNVVDFSWSPEDSFAVATEKEIELGYYQHSTSGFRRDWILPKKTMKTSTNTVAFFPCTGQDNDYFVHSTKDASRLKTIIFDSDFNVIKRGYHKTSGLIRAVSIADTGDDEPVGFLLIGTDKGLEGSFMGINPDRIDIGRPSYGDLPGIKSIWYDNSKLMYRISIGKNVVNYDFALNNKGGQWNFGSEVLDFSIHDDYVAIALKDKLKFSRPDEPRDMTLPFKGIVKAKFNKDATKLAVAFGKNLHVYSTHIK
jgi:hypothetical protein